jgi:hypothetical protein
MDGIMIAAAAAATVIGAPGEVLNQVSIWGQVLL